MYSIINLAFLKEIIIMTGKTEMTLKVNWIFNSNKKLFFSPPLWLYTYKFYEIKFYFQWIITRKKRKKTLQILYDL